MAFTQRENIGPGFEVEWHLRLDWTIDDICGLILSVNKILL